MGQPLTSSMLGIQRQCLVPGWLISVLQKSFVQWTKQIVDRFVQGSPEGLGIVSDYLSPLCVISDLDVNVKKALIIQAFD